MLIINADDFGRDSCATDRALLCHQAQRISSTTAMVFMEDSERAAELAGPAGIGVGLHINFAQPFTARSVPVKLAAAHLRVSRFLKTNKHALLLFHPFLSRDFEYSFSAQHSEFLRLYGRSPTHFDGHQHLHLSTNVLAGHILPPGTKVRRSFTFFRGEKGLVNRLYRRSIDRVLGRRHVTTDYFFSLAHHLSPGRLERVVKLSVDANFELMTHPALQDEFDFLTGAFFREAISKTRLGSYVELKKLL